MPHRTFVSFEPDLIRVLTVKSRGNRVEHALTLSNEEFEQFLQNDHSSDYHIIINSPDAVYDTINIPPVKSNLIRTQVQNETKRLFTNQAEFTTSFRSVDEIFQDNKTIQRIACCMVPDAFLFSILEPFIRHNKSVSRIVSAPLILSELVSATYDTTEDIFLCAYDGGHLKTIFLLENGCVTLVRHLPSEGQGWDSHDLLNVSMTQDFCFQSLRVRPAHTVAINSTDQQTTMTPLETGLCQTYPDLIQEYLPLLAAMTLPSPATDDLRPNDYLQAFNQQRLLRNIIRGFASGCAVIVLILLCNLYSVISLNSEIDYARKQEQSLPAVLETYQGIQQQFSTIEPLIKLIVKTQSEPSIPQILSLLPPAQNGTTNISSVKISNNNESATINISGYLTENNYETMQQQFEILINKIAKTKGVSITSRQLNPKDQTFYIQAAYKQ